MIAHAKKLRVSTLHGKFLDMLPTIRSQAQVAFRGEQAELREELVAEVIANCFVAFVRLMDRGLDDVVYPTPLAQFAIRQVREGRKVGTKLNVNDVSSEYAQPSMAGDAFNLAPGHERWLLVTLWIDHTLHGSWATDIPTGHAPVPNRSKRGDFLPNRVRLDVFAAVLFSGSRIHVPLNVLRSQLVNASACPQDAAQVVLVNPLGD